MSRLEQIFEMREEKPKGTKCHGINGFISEGESATGNVSDTRVLDAAIIASAQAVELYAITRYGSLIAWATEMGRKDFADILRENLAEEEAANERLSLLGVKVVNKRAAGKPTVRGRGVSAASSRKQPKRKSAKTRARKSA